MSELIVDSIYRRIQASPALKNSVTAVRIGRAVISDEAPYAVLSLVGSNSSLDTERHVHGSATFRIDLAHTSLDQLSALVELWSKHPIGFNYASIPMANANAIACLPSSTVLIAPDDELPNETPRVYRCIMTYELSYEKGA